MSNRFDEEQQKYVESNKKDAVKRIDTAEQFLLFHVVESDGSRIEEGEYNVLGGTIAAIGTVEAASVIADFLKNEREVGMLVAAEMAAFANEQLSMGVPSAPLEDVLDVLEAEEGEHITHEEMEALVDELFSGEKPTIQ